MIDQSFQPSLLVLMASFNGSRHIAEQVSSLLRQRTAFSQIVVGDDNSTDSTVDVLSAIDSGGAIRIIQYRQSSGGAGQNFLRLMRDVDLTAAEFVAFCDQDDIWDDDKLSRATSALDAQNADGYSSAVTAFWPDGRSALLGQNAHRTDLDFLFEGAGQGCTFVLRGEFARTVQRFVQEKRDLLAGIHYHDWLIYAVSRSLGRRWAFDPLPSMRYRQHDDNDTGSRGALVGVRKRLSKISDGWYAGQVQQMIEVVTECGAGVSTIPADFLEIWRRRRGWGRRLSLALVLLRRGRRRASDRIVLAVSALLGWL